MNDHQAMCLPRQQSARRRLIYSILNEVPATAENEGGSIRRDVLGRGSTGLATFEGRLHTGSMSRRCHPDHPADHRNASECVRLSLGRPLDDTKSKNRPRLDTSLRDIGAE